MHALAGLTVGVLLTACASIGHPEGGPRDELPPVFLRSIPEPGALNVSRTRIEAVFDENIQLDDAFNKVIISPVQNQTPAVTANGKRLSVELRDTLLPNTTYTIDFGDAIKDLNEGNILDGFALDFSTGENIDTLRISGMVLAAENLEPAQGILVGLYSNLSDTAITSLPFERIARTNQYGQFTIRNLKPGDYRVYALNDLNRDYHWDRSEDVAFYDLTISPATEAITVTDTLRSSTGEDSTVTRPGVKYLPNDILLSWFNENYVAPYLKDYARTDRRRVTLTFAAPNDSGVSVTGVDGPLAGRPAGEWAYPDINASVDTLVYWLRPEIVDAADSLQMAVRYQRLDTAQQLSWTTDTLRVFFRDPDRNKKKKQDKKSEPADSDSIPLTFLTIKSLASNTLDIYRPLGIEADQPIASINSTAVHLSMLQDTIWIDVPEANLATDSLKPLQRRHIDIEWQPGTKYRLTIDSAAVVGVYNEWNKPFKHEFTVKKVEEYANLTFNVIGLDSATAVVELLSSTDAPVARATTDGSRATFRYVNPGQYYARLFIDSNGNGKWDTGKLLDSIQPEEVYYYEKKLNLKGNWDIEETWYIYALPIDMQKPYAIKKNKPKLKRGEDTTDDESEEEDEFDDFINGRSGSSSSTNRSGSSGFGGNGMQKAGSGNTLAR